MRQKFGAPLRAGSTSGLRCRLGPLAFFMVLHSVSGDDYRPELHRCHGEAAPEHPQEVMDAAVVVEGAHVEASEAESPPAIGAQHRVACDAKSALVPQDIRSTRHVLG